MYPGSRPLGGGSLRPAINPVYDHRLVYMGAAVGGGESRSNLMWEILPRGVPLVALFMQAVRVYKCTNGLCVGVTMLGLQSASRLGQLCASRHMHLRVPRKFPSRVRVLAPRR